MSDLISRQTAIDAILECCSSDCDNEYECGYDDGLRKGVHKLKHLPSAQPQRCEDCVNFSKTRLLIPQPEIIRCKDCRHRDPEDHKCDNGEDERQGCPFKVADDYFCAYGKR